MNRVSAEHKAEIKRCISRIPKDYDEDETPFELFIYEYQDGTNISDLDGFADFDGTMTNLEKVVNNIISRSKERLSHIDFKWCDRVGDFDQFTIYSV
jgi:hypothetical protein